jgi:hypothetical protein
MPPMVPCRPGRWRPSLSLLSVGILMACAGCSADGASGSSAEDVGSATLAIIPPSWNSATIHYADNRTASNVHVSIAAVDQKLGGFYAGTATTGGDLTGSGTKKASFMLWEGDAPSALTEVSYVDDPYGDPTSIIEIENFSSPPHLFTTMRITVQAQINGACHWDYEDVDISKGVDLTFNGNGASFNGTCWVGDLLKHTY